jgi:hypothetical protein
MDSVYDAALAHAEKLKTELETLQNFLDLHDHFRERFGLTTPAKAATSEPQAPVADQAGATHEIHVQEPETQAEALVEAEAPEAKAAAAAEAPEVESAAELEASEPQAAKVEAADAVEAEAVTETLAAATDDAATEEEAPALAAPPPETPEAEPDEKPRVIQASEGVLIAATPEAAAAEPLAADATLQSVADKLAATIAAHPTTVTGYTV